MNKHTIADELRAKKSRDNRELLDRAADYIENLEREIERVTDNFNCQQTVYVDLSKIIQELAENLKTAKAEAAREIFSEILNIIRGYSHSACIAKNNYGITQVEYIGADILKLKKKYTEGPNNAIQT